jgi:hypothetical protein
MHNGEAHTLRSHNPQELDALIAARTRVGVMMWGELVNYTLRADGVTAATIAVVWPDGVTHTAVVISGIDILYPSDA